MRRFHHSRDTKTPHDKDFRHKHGAKRLTAGLSGTRASRNASRQRFQAHALAEMPHGKGNRHADARRPPFLHGAAPGFAFAMRFILKWRPDLRLRCVSSSNGVWICVCNAFSKFKGPYFAPQTKEQVPEGHVEASQTKEQVPKGHVEASQTKEQVPAERTQAPQTKEQVPAERTRGRPHAHHAPSPCFTFPRHQIHNSDTPRT